MSWNPYAHHLLIPGQPFLLLPELAVAIGVEAAIVLQQLHFKLVTAGRDLKGERWFYHTLAQWHDEVFPFFSKRALERIFKGLKEQGLVKVRYDLNRHAYDRTAWYAIDYGAVQGLGLPNWAEQSPDPEQLSHTANLASCTGCTFRQNGGIHCAKTVGSIPPKPGNALRQNGGIPKDLYIRSKDRDRPAREGREIEAERQRCRPFDWTAVRALKAPLCSHLQETLALFRDLAYACEEAYYRKDSDGRLHEFAHDYDPGAQRAYIAYRQHQIETGELAPRFRSPSAMFKPDWVASDMPEALDWWRRRHASEQPESCLHKNVTEDGICLQCRQQLVRRPAPPS